jgi:deoxycytidylate deaminase
MNNKIFYYFNIAAKIAMSKNNRRHFILGSLAIRDDGAIVTAYNSPTMHPMRHTHSEFRLSRKLDYGATVYVARVNKHTSSFCMAKPCESCMKALLSKRVKKIFYTINDDEYGVIVPTY